MHARVLVIPVLVAACCGGFLSAAEPRPTPTGAGVKSAAGGKTAVEEFQQIGEGIRQAKLQFMQAKMEAVAPRLFALLDANSTDAYLGKGILLFLLNNEAPPAAAFKQKAVKLLTERFAADEKIPAFFLAARQVSPEMACALVERVVAVNPVRTVQAEALLQLGQWEADDSDMTQNEAKRRALRKKAEMDLQRLISRYGDVKYNGFTTCRDVAERYLTQLRLDIGTHFPDLEGVTVAGAKEQIASYRGKVVVLDFWITGCGPCEAMIPHECEMVDKLKRQPFALISVNGDWDRNEFESFLKKTPMPWIHWWGQADGGKLLKRLNITGYPTIYVLDGDGVIRYKNVRGEELTKAVEVCLAEIKKKNGAHSSNGGNRTVVQANTAPPGERPIAEFVKETPDAERPVVIGAVVQPANVKPGQMATLYVQARIAPRWHIYGKTSGESSRTALTLAPNKGVEPVGSWIYPAVKPNADGSAVHYEGTVTFRHQLRIAANAEPGSLEVRCEIAYQACDPFQCLLPTQKKLTATIVVVDK